VKEKTVEKVTDDISNNSPDSKWCDAEDPAQILKLINLKEKRLLQNRQDENESNKCLSQTITVDKIWNRLLKASNCRLFDHCKAYDNATTQMSVASISPQRSWFNPRPSHV